jgi:hypothetical protein
MGHSGVKEGHSQSSTEAAGSSLIPKMKGPLQKSMLKAGGFLTRKCPASCHGKAKAPADHHGLEDLLLQWFGENYSPF